MRISRSENPNHATLWFGSGDELAEFAFGGNSPFNPRVWIATIQASILKYREKQPSPKQFSHRNLAHYGNRMIKVANQASPVTPREVSDTLNMRAMAHEIMAYLCDQPLPGPDVIDLSHYPFPDAADQSPPTSPPDEWVY